MARCAQASEASGPGPTAAPRPRGRPVRILVVNPGSTSTKIAVFENGREAAQVSMAHAASDLAPFRRVAGQAGFRLALIRRWLRVHGWAAQRWDAVIGRGGLLAPIPGGVYRVNARMRAHLRAGRYGEHASNLGGLLAHQLARAAGCPAYIADPVVVDELEPTARMTGLPGLERKSIFHALNHKSVAREVARSLGKPYARCRLIVAHMGGGISVGAHRRGRIVDVNNALDGDGPLAPERAGTLPAGQLVDLCFKGRFGRADLRRILAGGGGLVAYRGSNQFSDLMRARRAGDPQARLLFETLACRVAQQIALHGATLRGRVDAIVLTGGLAFERALVRAITARVRFLAPVTIIPGERELESLARAALSAARGRAPVREYPP